MQHKSQLIFKLATHELRNGWQHFKIFLACLILGITVITTVGSLGSAMQYGLINEAQSLLGGDLEISLSGMEATAEQKEFLSSYGTVSHITTLRGMLQFKDNPTLVELKAVDNLYPLLGKLELDNKSTLSSALKNGIAVDASLLSQINAKIADEVKIGNAVFTINATIKQEPDKVVQIFSFGPRVMLSHESLAKTGLVTPLSLVQQHYRILLKDKNKIAQLREQLRDRFPETPFQVKTGAEGNQTIKRFTDQLIAFLSLAGFATFLIGGIGIGSSVRAYMEKKSHTIAIMKSIGAARASILCLYLSVIGILALCGCAVGIIISVLITALIFPLIGTWLPEIESGAVIYPATVILSTWYGVLIVYIFSLPALLTALEIRPALLFRSNSSTFNYTHNISLWKIEIILSALLVITLLLTASDKIFILGAMAVTIFMFGVFSFCTYIIKYCAQKVKVTRPWLRLALSNLYRPGATTGTIMLAIGISITVLISLTLTEANFQTRIARVINEQAPTLFLMDIQSYQRDALTTMLSKETNEKPVMIYPMARGRITALNGKPVNESSVSEDARWALHGDRGLSYSGAQPYNTQIAQGKWWPENYHGHPLVSIDDKLLEGMKLKLGDTITVNILEQDITAEIASTRHIDYTTLQINFAMMFSPGVIDTFPHSYLATAYLGHNIGVENSVAEEITKEFPGVTVIRTRQSIELVRDVMLHISQALRIAVIISLLTGLLVFTGAMSAMIEQRMYDVSILKILGARRRDILKIYTTEWILLGLCVCIVAIFIGTICSWLIIKRFRGEGFYLLPHVTISTTICCLGLVWIIYYLGHRRVFGVKPAKILRNE